MRKTLAHDSTSETDIHRSANAPIRKNTSVHFGSLRFSRSQVTLILLHPRPAPARCIQRFFDPPPHPWVLIIVAKRLHVAIPPTPPLPMLDRIAVFANVRTGLLAEIEKVLRRT